MKLTSDIKFSDLRVHYETGRAYTIKLNGYGKRTAYRNGKMTDIGDIESNKWCALMRELIHREKEDFLQADLTEWYHEYPALRDRKRLEEYTLELHAARVFDDEAWVDFVPFNRKYRPKVLEDIELIRVETMCCKKACQVTQRQIECAYDGKICCPYCGRYSEFAYPESPDCEAPYSYQHMETDELHISLKGSDFSDGNRKQ